MSCQSSTPTSLCWNRLRRSGCPGQRPHRSSEARSSPPPTTRFQMRWTRPSAQRRRRHPARPTRIFSEKRRYRRRCRTCEVKRGLRPRRTRSAGRLARRDVRSIPDQTCRRIWICGKRPVLADFPRYGTLAARRRKRRFRAIGNCTAPEQLTHKGTFRRQTRYGGHIGRRADEHEHEGEGQQRGQCRRHTRSKKSTADNGPPTNRRPFRHCFPSFVHALQNPMLTSNDESKL